MLFGSEAGIHCVTTVLSFLAYRWMYAADGMPCYVTLFWRKENISTNLCTFFSNAKTSSCSSDMTDGSYSILNLSDMCSCSPLFPLVVCCCCMSCCQHKIPWLCWQHRQIPSSPPPLRGKSERRKVTGVVHTFSCTRWPCPRSCVFSRMITWKPDQVSVVILKTPYWHHSLLLLHQASLFISTFFFSSHKTTDYLSLASELKSSVHQQQSSTRKPFQLSDRNPLFTVQLYTIMSNISQN